jgi:hypothetical protein
MADVRIYRPARNAMQSGRKQTRQWILEFEPQSPKFIDPLMGWTGSLDTRDQVRLHFATKEAAIAFADKHGLSYRLQEAQAAAPARPVSYAEKLRSPRLGRLA